MSDHYSDHETVFKVTRQGYGKWAVGCFYSDHVTKDKGGDLNTGLGPVSKWLKPVQLTNSSVLILDYYSA